METYFGEIEQAHGVIARERVLADLKTLARDSEDLLKATTQDVSDEAKAARSRLNSALARAKTTCSEWHEQAVITAKATARKADTLVRAHPYESIGIAFGVGLLIGVLAVRRTSGGRADVADSEECNREGPHE